MRVYFITRLLRRFRDSHRFKRVDKRVLLANLPQKSHGRLHRTGDHDILKEHVAPASDTQYVDEESRSSRFSPDRPETRELVDSNW
jgi:hypothetical protein